jgi:hypothetical protein
MIIRTAIRFDLAEFANLSERPTPSELVAPMNTYIAAMTGIIGSGGGFVDRLMGDAISVVFGALLDDLNYAVHALRAALRCRERARGTQSRHRRIPRSRVAVRRALVFRENCLARNHDPHPVHACLDVAGFEQLMRPFRSARGCGLTRKFHERGRRFPDPSVRLHAIDPPHTLLSRRDDPSRDGIVSSPREIAFVHVI